MRTHEHTSSLSQVHTVGPDFRLRKDISREDAVQILAETYCNVLSVAAQVGIPKLRLLPISGGIYSGVSGVSLEYCVFSSRVSGQLIVAKYNPIFVSNSIISKIDTFT